MSRNFPSIPRTDVSNGTWTIYSLFGLRLVSNFPLSKGVALLDNNVPPDLTFSCTVVESLPMDWSSVVPTYTSPFKTKNNESIAYVYRQDEYDVIHFTNIGDFYIWPDRIDCYQLQGVADNEIERWLVGTVLTLWLELHDIPVMHASAVVLEVGAIAFLANNSVGKSSLAASLLRCGYPLLTDDNLPITCSNEICFGKPGYSQLRLWPDQAEHFLGYFQNLELVHPAVSKRIVPVGSKKFGVFCDVPQPLRCFYVLSRGDQEEKGRDIEIKPLSPRDALIELIRYSFSNRILTAMGLQPKRLKILMKIARHVPMRQLSYPHGLKYLPLVCQKIQEDIKKT